MGLLDESRGLFIATPDSAKDQILYKWPDMNIRKFSRLIVAPDQMALFTSQGEILGQMPPGQHNLDAKEWPFLGMILDWISSGNMFRAELFFVGTREYRDNFGGRIDEVQDPQTGLVVTLRTHGEYTIKVVDMAALVLNLTGTVNVEDNKAITDWTDEQLLKAMRADITSHIVNDGWPILGLSARTPDLEPGIIARVNQELAHYGLAIGRLGNLNVKLDDNDEATLKGLAKDTAYSRLAGGYNQYAAGSAMIGAGEGMAQGGGGAAGMMNVIGLGLGQQAGAAGQGQPAPVPPAPGFAGGGAGYAQQAAASAPAAAGPCAACGAALPAGARFCPACGAAAPEAAGFCTGCGGTLQPGARFCATCGTAVGAAPAADAGATAPSTPPAPEAGDPPSPPAPPAG